MLTTYSPHLKSAVFNFFNNIFTGKFFQWLMRDHYNSHAVQIKEELGETFFLLSSIRAVTD